MQHLSIRQGRLIGWCLIFWVGPNKSICCSEGTMMHCVLGHLVMTQLVMAHLVMIHDFHR